MKNITTYCLLGSTILGLSITSVHAQEAHIGHISHHDHHSSAAPSPLPIMGDHTHAKGDWMVSYRASHMHMEGNRSGTDKISPTEIISTLSNPNAPPANVRVVPTKMDMDMHMVGAMVGITDNITLMGMAMYMRSEMEHITFAGMMGSTELGRFKTRSGGWGDTSITALYKAYETDSTKINLGLGISAPTGSIKEEDTVLTPMNTTPTLRLPYAMQLGSGTWDALPSITYSAHQDKLSWGAQYKGVIRLEDENAQDYRLGDKHALHLWTGYQFTPSFAANARLSGEHTGKIKGADANITVQTANPDNYGGKTVEIGTGFVYTPKAMPIKGLEFAADFALPLYQNLNGVQLERDWTASLGLTYRF